jgi:hypothetical protein
VNLIIITIIVLKVIMLVMLGIAVVLLRYPRQVDKIYDAYCDLIAKDNK